MQSIAFHGAAQTVTGSRHLITVDGKKILVDCGLFQGDRQLRELNWLPFREASDIDVVLITHAHTDHIGWLPRLVAEGYRGPIISTKATLELARISLPDSGRLQEEEARHRNKHRATRHTPALPLYTEQDAYACLKQFEARPYDTMVEIAGGCTFRFLFAGHIMGSAFIELYFPSGERILMGGDLGRYDTPIIKDPTVVEAAEYLVIESTYGNRLHPKTSPMDTLEEIMNDTFNRGCCLLVPSFAIGRTQELLYFISLLQEQGRVPRIPIFVDSPMATSVSQIYERIHDEHDKEVELAEERALNLMEPRGMVYIRDREQSKMLNAQKGPMMVISGSGMATGGRIVHHLMRRLNDHSTTVLFTGYQANGTLGRQLLEGAKRVKIMGREVDVNADMKILNSLSAHADQGEMLSWLKNFKRPPKTTFIVHGEPDAQLALQAKITEQLGWHTEIPHLGEKFDL